MVTWAAVFLLPVFVQSVQGRSALVAGLAMAPQGLITGLSTALAPRWLSRLTVRVTVLVGFAVLAVASLGLLLIAALYATHARTGGPVAALHAAGLVLIAIAAAGALGALGLPSLRNAALEY